ncbi:MAG: hypothetical protein JSU77_00415 [Fidelibacterota bacterium]|nr:MAG: hypothetical protein JSU77_00415 [Candidatus Neomarinimicrobiota bacterium]
MSKYYRSVTSASRITAAKVNHEQRLSIGKMIYVFEDHYALDLEPLTLTRGTFDLRCGALTHLERIRRVVGNQPLTLVVRPGLAARMQECYPDLSVNPKQVEAGLWLNGAALWDDAAWEQLLVTQGFVGADDRITGGNLTAELSREFYSHLKAGTNPGFSPQTKGPRLMRYLWDHLLTNADQITADFNRWCRDSVSTAYPKGVQVAGDSSVYLGKDVTIDPFVLLDTRDGPIWIDDGTTVNSHSVITGPSYIGQKCKVWPFSFLNEVILGPYCHVMGQIEGTIIQGYSNKQHTGFLGHAYLGSWINLGAGTSNSDLKNNYGAVKVSVNGKTVNTGETFIGCFIGDHTKTAIGIQFYTGTRVGVAANVFGSVVTPKVIPSFAWGGDGRERYDLDKCLKTIAIVKRRRGQELTKAERELYRRLYEEED